MTINAKNKAMPNHGGREKDASALIKAIKRHGRKGRHMFLLPPGSKVPAKGSHGFNDATSDVKHLIVEAKVKPDWNLALRTGRASGILAIDIDRHDHDGFATIKQLSKTWGTLPRTLVSRTPRAGEHRLYQCNGPMPSSQSGLGPDVDVRADDGYILIAPSMVGGKRYRWLQQDVKSPAKLPAEWRDAIREAARFDPGDVFCDQPIRKGVRNTVLTQMAFELRRRGKSKDDVLADLRSANEKRCRPTEKDSRLVSLVGRVFKRGTLPEPASTPPKLRPVRQTTTLAEIDKLEMKPLRWAIRKILPEGVALVAGPPKIGKSILMLQKGLAVACGSRLWDVKPEHQGHVLYIAYEDNNRRMQKRARQLMGGKPLPKRFHVDYAWPRMDAGGIEDLDNWLKVHPKMRLVIIDTLAQFRSLTTKSRTAYDYDYAVGQAMVPLATKYHVAIVLVHHTAKGHREDVLESINSTNGLPGGVDTVMVLSRERGCEDGALFVTGRDIEEERSWAMTKQEKKGWAIVGSVADAQRSAARQAILTAINDHGPSTPVKIAEYTGKKREAIRQLLMHMTSSGEVQLVGDAYEVPSKKKF
jgi:hypothetical protein